MMRTIQYSAYCRRADPLLRATTRTESAVGRSQLQDAHSPSILPIISVRPLCHSPRVLAPQGCVWLSNWSRRCSSRQRVSAIRGRRKIQQCTSAQQESGTLNSDTDQCQGAQQVVCKYFCWTRRSTATARRGLPLPAAHAHNGSLLYRGGPKRPRGLGARTVQSGWAVVDALATVGSDARLADEDRPPPTAAPPSISAGGDTPSHSKHESTEGSTPTALGARAARLSEATGSSCG